LINELNAAFLDQKDLLASPKSKPLPIVSCFDDVWQGSTTQQDANQILSEQLDLSDTPLVDYKAASLNVDWQPDFSFVKRRIFVRSPNKAKDPVVVTLPVRIYDDAARKIDFEFSLTHIQNDTLLFANEKEKEDKSINIDRDVIGDADDKVTTDNINNTAEAKRLKNKRKRQKEKERKKKKRRLLQEQTNVNNTNVLNNVNAVPDVSVR